MRNFQIDQQFEAIKKAAIEAVQSIFPMEGKLRSIRLNRVWVDDSLDLTDYKDQAKTKAQDGTWGATVYASLTLIDKGTGKTVDQKDKVKLFTLPKLTNRFSYIVNGNEYQVQNQMRLKSGVYTLIKRNGELKTMVNLASGKNFDLGFDESTGIFTIRKIAGGQSNIPLYPILVHLGVSPSLIAREWGSELEAANRNTDPKAVSRAKAAFGVKTGELSDYFAKTEISPDTTKIALGQSFSKVDGPMLLAASKNLLETHQGKREPMDRDSLEFKDLLSVEDFIKERLEKNQKTLAYRVQRNIDNPKRTQINQIVNPGAFNSLITSFFTQDDRSSTPEQTNPLEMVTGQYKVTIMGPGGISNEHSLTPEMRQIHPTHYGFLDPVHTPEAGNIGAALHLPLGIRKDGRDFKMIVVDKNGKEVSLTPGEAKQHVIAFPNQSGNTVKVMHEGKIKNVPRSEVEYFTPSPIGLFSWAANMIPFFASDQGNRALMAAKMMEQAISLKHREAPLVQVGARPNTSLEQEIGRQVAIVAPEDGTVKKIDGDMITLKTASGTCKINLYNHFTLNRKSFLHHEPLVKVGDQVKKGQILADSNFTKDGTLALGVNLKTAYLPYKGLNFEDGIVITDSAAERLTSVHIHKKTLDLDDRTILNSNLFKNIYPNALTAENLRKLDQDGVIKKGETVHHGEALIAALRKRTISKELGLIHKQLSDRPKDASVIWHFEDDGVIQDVQKAGGRITVMVKTEERAKIGDKLAGRHGNKGIITKIIPDKEAPHTADGEPVDIILNPHGVMARLNVGQIYESAAAKAAHKTGTPHRVYNFRGDDHYKDTTELLKKAKVDDKEELIDPLSGKSLGRVHVGRPHILKLYKLGTSNFSVRQGGPGHPYDLNMQPLKAGGEDAAKSMDLLTVYSMLSHGARANLREMSTYKSDANDEFWTALKAGQMLPPPRSPFVYDKFLGYLKGAGIDVNKEGTKLTLSPLTDEQIKKISAGEVKRPHFYRAKDFQPMKGGFFDPVIFGGMRGTKWGHLELKEPVVNPVFEKAVKKITGLGNKFDDIMAGKVFVTKDGDFNSDGKGVTGGAAIEQILKGINVDIEYKKLEKKALTATKTQLDDINKRLRYLKALKELKLRPEEAYIRRTMPVVPPLYRPIYPLPDGNVTTSDVNVLYQNTGVLNAMMDLKVASMLPPEELAAIRKDIYHHVKAVSGLTDMNVKGRIREGFISAIKGGHGGQPKEGFFIDKLLSKKQDFVGRGTIIPEPELGVDEVALPEEMAWRLFEPFVVRELKSHGKSPVQALDEIKKRTPLARKALDIVMKERHVLLNRAPSLHKFSIMALQPKITSGRAIKIPPLIVRGFNADFDGDTMTVHVPITEEANREAEKMRPSRNLFQPGTNKLMLVPQHEAQTGIYYLSKTPAGRAKLNQILGAKYAISDVLDKKKTADLLLRLAKELPTNEFADKVGKLKTAGENQTFERGFTLGLDDIPQFGKMRDKVVNLLDRLVTKAKTQEEVAKISQRGQVLVDQLIDKHLAGKENPMYDMVRSGARGDKSQVRQILMSPLFVSDERGRVVPSVIKRSYSEGLDIGDYWVSLYGARRGMIDKSVQTSKPGGFSKEIMATTIDNVISGEDCGTRDGINLKVEDPNVLDRYLAGNQGGLTHNTLLDGAAVTRLKKAGLTLVKVRSPLTCRMAKGTCARCHGLDEHGHSPSLGENVGAKAGQTIGEPLVQMSMNTFHTGGVAGTGVNVQGFARIEQLLELPKVVAGSAPLAPVSGKVEKIEKGLAGGFDVTIAGRKVHIPTGLALKVKVGQVIERGDPLSQGVIKPQDLVEHKGMRPAQEYIVNELHNAYASQGQHIQKRTFETIVRSLGNTTRVLNNPKHTDHVPGDVIPYTAARHHNENLTRVVPVDEAEGEQLAEQRGPFQRGHEIQKKDVAFLKALGHKEVPISLEPIQHAPFLKGLKTLPLLKKNWMGALGFQNLSKVLTEGAGQAWSTDLEDYHPVPALAHGANFGKGKQGKY